MSMQPEEPGEPGEIPAETVRVARAAFRKGSLAIRIRDELVSLFTDEEFADLFPARESPWSPSRLALVLVSQFAEGLTDRQAAEAVRRGSIPVRPRAWNSVIRASPSRGSRSSGTVWPGRMPDGRCWTTSSPRPGRRTCWSRAGRLGPIPHMCCRRPAN